MSYPPAELGLSGREKRGFQERNLSRLNPILGLNRIPDTMITWSKRVELDEHGPIDVICTTQHGQIVPHGTDGDVLFAIQTLYRFKGDKDRRTVRTNLSELSKFAGMLPSGYAYKRVREALVRLRAVSYQAEACWGLEGRNGWRWWSRDFNLINDVHYITDLKSDPATYSADNPGVQSAKFTADTEVVIELGRVITDSINAGHVSLLSYTLYEQLSQPLSRLIYRVLEEYRAKGERISFPLKGWGEHLGLIETHTSLKGSSGRPASRPLEPNRIKRALKTAHDDLIESSYLSRVDYQGKGANTEITYTFCQAELIPVNPDTIKLLTQYGVTLLVAEQKVRQHGEDHVRLVVRTFSRMIADGIAVPRNRAGYLLTMLEKPENYTLDVARETLPTMLKEPSQASEGSDGSADPERTVKTAEVALKQVLTNAADQEVRQQVIDLFMAGRISVLNIIEMSHQSDPRNAALDLIQQHSV